MNEPVTAAALPYRRLSGFYFFDFATLGVLVPYWGLYLQSLGFSARAIGELTTLVLAARIVAPLLWAWIADHYRLRMALVRPAALLTVLIFSFTFWARDYWALAAIMTGFSFFWNATLPVLEVHTLNHLGSRRDTYGHVRLWGSLGFIASVLSVGPVVEHYGAQWVVPALFALLCGILAASLLLPEAEATPTGNNHKSLRAAVWQVPVLAFLASALLMQASHGPYYTFYSLYLAEQGYGKDLIGALWAFAVLCEIGVFVLMPRIRAQFGLKQILLAAFALAALRWWLIARFPSILSVLVLAQTLHAVTFGAYHAAAVQVVFGFFKGSTQHRGQALYGSVSYGIGGALGSLMSGYVWTRFGPSATFGVSVMLAATAYLVCAWGLKISAAGVAHAP